MCFVKHPCCICSAPCAFQRVRSFMQQRGWIILSSSGCCCCCCCCMAEGATLSTLAQQHAYITEHVLGVIQPASVYSGAITRPSSGTFSAPRVALQRLLTSANICRHLPASAILVKLQRLHVDANLTLLQKNVKRFNQGERTSPQASMSSMCLLQPQRVRKDGRGGRQSEGRQRGQDWVESETLL